MECKQFSLQKNGFKGTFYEGSSYKDKVVIYIGGAFLNEKITNDSSEFLRNAGYSVMVVGFYLWDGLPKEMYHISVEYIENAIKWLKNSGYHRIGIMGTSTGAGYALLCASLLSDINCVIAVSPFDYVMEGVKGKLNPQNCSVYQYKGKDIPYTKFNVLHGNLCKEFVKFFKNKDYDNKHMNRYAYDMANYTEESRIKIENMKADILMMAPRYDDSWPSTEAVNRMEIILKNCHYPYRVRKIIYENGSHALGYWKLDKKFKLLMKYMYSIEKKYPLECEKVREESTQAILDFIREW